MVKKYNLYSSPCTYLKTIFITKTIKMNIDKFLNYLLLSTHCKLTKLLVKLKTLN